MTKTEINRPFRSGFLSYLCPFSLAWSLGWWMGLIGLCGDRVLGSSDPSYTHLVQWVGPSPPSRLSVKNHPAVQETKVWSLGREDPQEKGMAIHSSVLIRKFRKQRSLACYSPWGHKESDMTEWLTHILGQSCMGVLAKSATSWNPINTAWWQAQSGLEGCLVRVYWKSLSLPLGAKETSASDPQDTEARLIRRARCQGPLPDHTAPSLPCWASRLW